MDFTIFNTPAPDFVAKAFDIVVQELIPNAMPGQSMSRSLPGKPLRGFTGAALLKHDSVCMYSVTEVELTRVKNSTI